MRKFVKKRSKKVGLPPGTLVHIGEKKSEQAKITMFTYDQANSDEKELSTIEQCVPLKTEPTVSWINIDGLHDVGLLEKVGTLFSIHPLVLEDILNTDQRPKVEDYGDYLVVILKMLQMNNLGDTVEAEQVSLIVGSNYVLSFQERTGDVFDHVRTRLRAGRTNLRSNGADYLAYALMDAVIDNYFVILEKMGEKIEVLEEELIAAPEAKTLQTIHMLKRELIYLRKSVWPLREILSSLVRQESPLIKEPSMVYFRDVYDHTIQVIDTIETFREMVSGMLDIYLSSVSNRMNEVMKVLTIIATIFIPLTFIVGIYGMNFEYFPELRWPWAYPAVLGIMGVIAVVMLFYFRKKRWL